ncbi:MAG: lipoyl(octanoyl) transferase LipB [Bacteroidales bacterium]|jgi:lipoyl(octanoyl) transferase
MQHFVHFIDLGPKEYKEAWEFQERVHSRVLDNRSSQGKDADAGTLLFCEHPHVYTLGKSGQSDNLLINEDFLKKINATFYRSNRGGDITYHGPGQIVGYPVFDLDKLKSGVRTYIYSIEKTIIKTLEKFTIESGRLDGATGVWLDAGQPTARKICAIGVRISRAVTMHGFALNVNTDLNYFSYINPCGFQDKGITSMQKELGREVDPEAVKNELKTGIKEVFSLREAKENS